MAIQDQRPVAAGDALPFDPRDAPGYLLPPPAPVSWDDFLAWLDDNTRAEWVAGEIIEMPPASEDHQDNGGFLFPLLLLHIQRNKLGRIFYAPFLMRLSQKPSGREPDLLFVNTDHVGRIRPTYLEGPADLIVEIVSPDSVARDYGDKLAEYEAAGIPEYWIIDPLRRDARFYQLGDDGAYRPAAVAADGIYTSQAVPGFKLRVSWLWQRPLPTIDEALADLLTE